ncbi:hypothetical protein GCM10009548_01880 [Streptomyces malaysiensis subsp. malaysiensis]|uniref:Deoxynucleoside monophosphate kinase n=1 Tax=Streptomyces malaysiensis TaxID=92644 RepID=A0ABX6W4D9_STRMQ|nr:MULTISPECIES: hypothetical protein [Streptomyces]QPI56347.1 hypothetical protein I1A49_16610 [Streptomyces solisilvae]UHH17834.1 hypothetical protein LUV23_16725 [Streptomyces sp. HNM0561]
MPNIGILGRARSGKDTAGRWLVENRGYNRVAFADPLREAALDLDPIVDTFVARRASDLETVADVLRLSDVVGDMGWDQGKDDHPEIRRILQQLGHSIRTLDEDFWLRQALKTADEASQRTGLPCVITDVRYPNEVAALRERGWHLVYIDRPGVPQLDHPSERLTEDDADYVLHNDSDLSHFLREVEWLWEKVNRFETRRETNRSTF